MPSPPPRHRPFDVLDDGVDHLDRLPDEILLLIFNQIGDVIDLGRCSAVSRRFHALIPLVENIVIGIDCIIPTIPIPSPPPVDPTHDTFDLSALTQILAPNSKRSPAEVLHNFREIRRLRIGIPAGELSVDQDGVLLKWNATFGSSLESCVVIYASSVLSSSSAAAAAAPKASVGGDDNDVLVEAFFTDGRLKRRASWTFVSLIAASARHYILHPIVTDHSNSLQSLDFTDADGQGVLTMDRRQLQGLLQAPTVSLPRPVLHTVLPALKLRLWYAPRLDLPGGIVLEGATLVAVRPSEEWTRDAPGGSMDWVCNAFEEPYRTAARMLLKHTCYSRIELKSFGEGNGICL